MLISNHYEAVVKILIFCKNLCNKSCTLSLANNHQAASVIIYKRRVMRFNYFLLSSFLIMITHTGRCQTSKVIYNDSSFIASVLQQQNTYRNALQLPAFIWSGSLAKDAKAWAEHLAKIDKGQHDQSIVGKEGENLWWGTAGAFSFTDMVSMWGNEKAAFRYGVFPDCGKGMIGHYTQIVWKNTQSVGCALASNGKTDYLVCRYASPGNVIGEKPY